ncbi:MAG TPA: hypothetical protein VHX86_06200 [Tepidisphaeraceae bacterium]|nr:hypothetical protein [Tepidisphaeraceae bacterium]
MTRKKDITDTSAANETTSSATAVAELAPASEGETNDQEGQASGKTWGPAYKAIFSCPAMGFEMGEDRRFKQRLFKFVEKPQEHVLAALKEHGFTYRASEKAWTINATAENRVLSDRLAQEFAGVEQGLSR